MCRSTPLISPLPALVAAVVADGAHGHRGGRVGRRQGRRGGRTSRRGGRQEASGGYAAPSEEVPVYAADGSGDDQAGYVDGAASDSADAALAMLQGSIPGVPGEDYPIYAEVPETGFSCDGQVDGGEYELSVPLTSFIGSSSMIAFPKMGRSKNQFTRSSQPRKKILTLA